MILYAYLPLDATGRWELLCGSRRYVTDDAAPGGWRRVK